MSDLLASIFHVTDMHLLVDAEGRLRKPQLETARLFAEVAHRASSYRLRRLAGRILWHEEEALRALQAELPDLLAQELYEGPSGAPVVVCQTGDIEALGSCARREVTGYDAFPSFAFVNRHLTSASEHSSWIDLYGNHDTWPGTYPPMAWRKRAINRARIATIPGFEARWPDVRVFDTAADVPLVVARVNTVSRTLLRETQASGTVCDHPPHGQSCQEVLDDLATALEPWRDIPAIRIVLVHHPPHAFGVPEGRRLVTAELDGASEFARCLSVLRVQLVIAGHRHKLDPALDTEDGDRAQQLPLTAPTLQLVAESPTQETVDAPDDQTDYEDLQPTSFCRYRLWATNGAFDVERTVFRFTDGRGDFSSEPSAIVACDLPLV